MLMKRCYFRGCKSNSVNVSKGLLKGVSFIGLPDRSRDLNRWAKWFQLCGISLKDETELKDVCICSLHFIDLKGPTAEHPDPVMYVTDSDATETDSDEPKDVSLYVINDRARVMLEHSYATLDYTNQAEKNIKSLSSRISRPFRGFNSAQALKSLKISTTVVISGGDLPKLSGIKRKAKCVKSKQSDPPAKKRRRRRKSILFKKKSTAPKKFQRTASCRKNQEPFTFVEVEQEKMNKFIHEKDGGHSNNSTNKLTGYEEAFRIKEEIPDRTDSDTLSVPSPRTYIYSDEETESCKSGYLSREYIRTTIVKECNLPDSPENDPLSLTSGDFDNKNNAIEMFSEHAPSSGASTISFAFVPKEEPEDSFEDKFDVCQDFCGQNEMHLQEQLFAERICTGVSPALALGSQYSDFTSDIVIKQENVDDISSSAENGSCQNAVQHFITEVPRSNVCVGSPASHFESAKVPVHKCAKQPILSSCTCDKTAGNQHSAVVCKLHGESVTTPIPADPCSTANSSLNKTCGRNHFNLKKQKKVVKISAERVQTANQFKSPVVNLKSIDCTSVSPDNVKNATGHVLNEVSQSDTSDSEHKLSGRQNSSSCTLPVTVLACSAEKVAQRLPQNIVKESCVRSSENISCEGAQNLSHVVQRKVHLVLSKNLPVSTRAVPDLCKIVKKNYDVCLCPDSTKVPSTNFHQVCHVHNKVLVISSDSMQTSAEPSQNMPCSVKDDSKNVHFLGDKNTKHLQIVGNKVITSPTLVNAIRSKNSCILPQNSQKRDDSSCKCESVCTDSSHDPARIGEENVCQTSPQKGTIPDDRVSSSTTNCQQPTKFDQTCSRCVHNQVNASSSENKFIPISSGGDSKKPMEFVQKTNVKISCKCKAGKVRQVDIPTTSVHFPNQSSNVDSSHNDVYDDSNLNSVHSHLGQYNTVTATSRFSNLLSHRSRYTSAMEKLNKRMRFLSRLKTILGSKNCHPYRYKK